MRFNVDIVMIEELNRKAEKETMIKSLEHTIQLLKTNNSPFILGGRSFDVALGKLAIGKTLILVSE